MMYRYNAYGLTIESAFELPELPACSESGQTPDIVFERGSVEPAPESAPGKRGRRIQASPGRCRLTYDAFGTFLVEDGTRVTFDPGSSEVTDTMAVRRLFENEILGVAHHLRGNLVLHASAVSVNGRGAVFLGPRGAGKSTTAAAFSGQGYTVLEDDVVAIDIGGERPTLFPGVPQLRLKPDAVEALGIEGTTTHRDDGGSGKQYLELEPASDPVPFSRCYLLQDGEPIRFEELPARDRVVELVSRTHAQGLVRKTAMETDHFQQCTTVADSVPFQKLYRPRDHEELPAVVEAVASDLFEDGDS